MEKTTGICWGENSSTKNGCSGWSTKSKQNPVNWRTAFIDNVVNVVVIVFTFENYLAFNPKDFDENGIYLVFFIEKSSLKIANNS